MAEKRVEPACDDEAERCGEGLLEERARGDWSVAISVGEICEGVAERIEIGEDWGEGAADLEDEASVHNVLAGGAPVDEACCFGILFCDGGSELLDERDGEIGGLRNGGGERGEID